MLTLRKPYDGEDISQLDAFDFTKLSAVNTCPRWGIIRYGHHKTTSAGGRAMALEAGEACHQVFAAIRVFDLMTHGPKVYGTDDVKAAASNRAYEMFGAERTSVMLEYFLDSREDERTRVIRGALHILETSGFYDDPGDKRRTLDKLSEAIIAYVDRYEFGQSVPYVSGSFVGIEVPFELVAEYVGEGGIVRRVRFYGRIDGVHCYRNDIETPYIEENKTASRLNDAWSMSFETSHQVTGYIAAARTITGLDITKAKVIGLAIPQPRLYDEGILNIRVSRAALQFMEWGKWFRHTAELYFKHFDQPLQAPMYTGSCNRYFRPCSFVPLCASRDNEEQEEMMDMMVKEEWSPLHEKAGD